MLSSFWPVNSYFLMVFFCGGSIMSLNSVEEWLLIVKPKVACLWTYQSERIRQEKMFWIQTSPLSEGGWRAEAPNISFVMFLPWNLALPHQFVWYYNKNYWILVFLFPKNTAPQLLLKLTLSFCRDRAWLDLSSHPLRLKQHSFWDLNTRHKSNWLQRATSLQV